MMTPPRFVAVLALLVTFVAEASAGTLDDSATLFGRRAEEVRTALAGLPVSIETRQTQPSEGLRAYADQRVYKEFERGFVVVITTEPRGWRISMNPNSLATPEHVRVLGDRLASSFKRGQFVEGATQLAASLNQLTLPKVETPRSVTTAPVSRPARPVTNYPPIHQETHSSGFVAVFMVMFVGILAISLIMFFLIRSQRRRLASPPANTEDARKTFDAYTPAQREQLAARHASQANGDILNDPMAFATMLFIAQQSAEANTASNLSSPPSFDSSSSSISSSISSSSDSSGAGGSW